MSVASAPTSTISGSSLAKKLQFTGRKQQASLSEEENKIVESAIHVLQSNNYDEIQPLFTPVPENLITISNIFKEHLKEKVGTKSLDAIFIEIDTDKSNYLSREEFHDVFKDMGVFMLNQRNEFFDHMDRNKNGSISFDEFRAYMQDPAITNAAMYEKIDSILL